MTDVIVSEEFYDEVWWDDYGSDAPTAATVRYWRYATAGGKEYLQAGFTFAAAAHDFTATSLGSGGFSFTLASLPTGFQGRRIHREARATGPLASYPVQPWDGYATAYDEDDSIVEHDATQSLVSAEHSTTRTHVTTEANEVQVVVDAIRSTDVPAIQSNIDGEGTTTRSLVQAENDATQTQLATHDTDVKTRFDTVDVAHADIKGTGFVSAEDSLAASKDEHDATQAQVQSLQGDFDTFEVVNQNEHDATQSAINTIGAAADAAFHGPPELTVPDSGTKTYRLYFTLKDLDASPVALVDPDNSRVTVAVEDQSGATPAGLTLSDSDGVTAGSQMTRDAQGEYHMDLTVSPTATIGDQVRFRANWERSAVANSALLTSRFVDIDPQLARIEANTLTIMTRIGESGDLGSVSTLFGRVRNVDEDLSAHDTDIKARLTSIDTDLSNLLSRIGVDASAWSLHQKLGAFTNTENLKAVLGTFTSTDNLRAVVGAYTAAASLKAALDAEAATNQAEHDATQQAITDLNDPTAASIADAVWDEAKAAHVAAGSFGEEVQSHATPTEVKTQADVALAEYDPPTRAEATADKAEVLAQLADGTYGLAALNTDLDSILSRLGLTTDTGGTTSAGTTQAKLNAILALAVEIEEEVVGPSESFSGDFGG